MHHAGAGECVGKLKSLVGQLVLTSFLPDLLPELLIPYFPPFIFSVQPLFRELIDHDKKRLQPEGGEIRSLDLLRTGPWAPKLIIGSYPISQGREVTTQPSS